MFKKYWRHPLPYFIALIMLVLYLSLPSISQWMVSHPNYRNYAHHDARMITSHIQKSFVYPFGKMLSYGPRSFLVFPYWVILIVIVRGIYLHTKRIWKYVGILVAGILIFLLIFPNSLLKFENDKPSVVEGHVGNGGIKNAKRIPFKGKNFTTYSWSCYLLGRTFVSDQVRKTVMDAYEECVTTCPEVPFILGETGFAQGGRFIPHRTHQNGQSVDFMTPLLKNEKPYTSNHLFNLWGYAWEFDRKGVSGKVEIDYETMVKHLLALDKTASENGLAIQKVIFDPVLKPYLLKAKGGNKIAHLPFTKNRVVIRHDDHYHVDFGKKN